MLYEYAHKMWNVRYNVRVDYSLDYFKLYSILSEPQCVAISILFYGSKCINEDFN